MRGQRLILTEYPPAAPGPQTTFSKGNSYARIRRGARGAALAAGIIGHSQRLTICRSLPAGAAGTPLCRATPFCCRGAQDARFQVPPLTHAQAPEQKFAPARRLSLQGAERCAQSRPRVGCSQADRAGRSAPGAGTLRLRPRPPSPHDCTRSPRSFLWSHVYFHYASIDKDRTEQQAYLAPDLKWPWAVWYTCRIWPKNGVPTIIAERGSFERATASQSR
jgi:hypothetical protein